MQFKMNIFILKCFFKFIFTNGYIETVSQETNANGKIQNSFENGESWYSEMAVQTGTDSDIEYYEDSDTVLDKTKEVPGARETEYKNEIITTAKKKLVLNEKDSANKHKNDNGPLVNRRKNERNNKYVALPSATQSRRTLNNATTISAKKERRVTSKPTVLTTRTKKPTTKATVDMKMKDGYEIGVDPRLAQYEKAFKRPGEFQPAGGGYPSREHEDVMYGDELRMLKSLDSILNKTLKAHGVLNKNAIKSNESRRQFMDGDPSGDFTGMGLQSPPGHGLPKFRSGQNGPDNYGPPEYGPSPYGYNDGIVAPGMPPGQRPGPPRPPGLGPTQQRPQFGPQPGNTPNIGPGGPSYGQGPPNDYEAGGPDGEATFDGRQFGPDGMEKSNGPAAYNYQDGGDPDGPDDYDYEQGEPEEEPGAPGPGGNYGQAGNTGPGEPGGNYGPGDYGPGGPGSNFGPGGPVANYRPRGAAGSFQPGGNFRPKGPSANPGPKMPDGNFRAGGNFGPGHPGSNSGPVRPQEVDGPPQGGYFEQGGPRGVYSPRGLDVYGPEASRGPGDNYGMGGPNNNLAPQGPGRNFETERPRGPVGNYGPGRSESYLGQGDYFGPGGSDGTGGPNEGNGYFGQAREPERPVELRRPNSKFRPGGPAYPSGSFQPKMLAINNLMPNNIVRPGLPRAPGVAPSNFKTNGNFDPGLQGGLRVPGGPEMTGVNGRLAGPENPKIQRVSFVQGRPGETKALGGREIPASQGGIGRPKNPGIQRGPSNPREPGVQGGSWVQGRPNIYVPGGPKVPGGPQILGGPKTSGRPKQPIVKVRPQAQKVRGPGSISNIRQGVTGGYSGPQGQVPAQLGVPGGNLGPRPQGQGVPAQPGATDGNLGYGPADPEISSSEPTPHQIEPVTTATTEPQKDGRPKNKAPKGPPSIRLEEVDLIVESILGPKKTNKVDQKSAAQSHTPNTQQTATMISTLSPIPDKFGLKGNPGEGQGIQLGNRPGNSQTDPNIPMAVPQGVPPPAPYSPDTEKPKTKPTRDPYGPNALITYFPEEHRYKNSPPKLIVSVPVESTTSNLARLSSILYEINHSGPLPFDKKFGEEYQKLKREHNLGIFTGFVMKAVDLIIKQVYDIQWKLIHAFSIFVVKKLGDDPSPDPYATLDFGQPFKKHAIKYAVWVTQRNDTLETNLKLVYHALEHRKTLLSKDLNSILDYTDELYNNDDDIKLTALLEAIKNFPSGRLIEPILLADRIMNTFIVDVYKRWEFRKEWQVLIVGLNTYMSNIFGGDIVLTEPRDVKYHEPVYIPSTVNGSTTPMQPLNKTKFIERRSIKTIVNTTIQKLKSKLLEHMRKSRENNNKENNKGVGVFPDFVDDDTSMSSGGQDDLNLRRMQNWKNARKSHHKTKKRKSKKHGKGKHKKKSHRKKNHKHKKHKHKKHKGTNGNKKRHKRSHSDTKRSHSKHDKKGRHKSLRSGRKHHKNLRSQLKNKITRYSKMIDDFNDDYPPENDSGGDESKHSTSENSREEHGDERRDSPVVRVVDESDEHDLERFKHTSVTKQTTQTRTLPPRLAKFTFPPTRTSQKTTRITPHSSSNNDFSMPSTKRDTSKKEPPKLVFNSFADRLKYFETRLKESDKKGKMVERLGKDLEDSGDEASSVAKPEDIIEAARRHVNRRMNFRRELKPFESRAKRSVSPVSIARRGRKIREIDVNEMFQESVDVDKSSISRESSMSYIVAKSNAVSEEVKQHLNRDVKFRRKFKPTNSGIKKVNVARCGRKIRKSHRKTTDSDVSSNDADTTSSLSISGDKHKKHFRRNHKNRRSHKKTTDLDESSENSESSISLAKSESIHKETKRHKKHKKPSRRSHKSQHAHKKTTDLDESNENPESSISLAKSKSIYKKTKRDKKHKKRSRRNHKSQQSHKKATDLDESSDDSKSDNSVAKPKDIIKAARRDMKGQEKKNGRTCKSCKRKSRKKSKRKSDELPDFVKRNRHKYNVLFMKDGNMTAGKSALIDKMVKRFETVIFPKIDSIFKGPVKGEHELIN